MSKAKKQRNKRVSAKIRVLRHENVPERQAVAEALNMERSHRLGPHGEYKRSHRKTKRGHKRRGGRY